MNPGPCPWCGLDVDAGLTGAKAPLSRRCPCGATAFGAAAADLKTVVDAMVAHYGFQPSSIHGDIYLDEGWLKDFHVEARPGPLGEGVRWHWYKRDLPWAVPAGPMTDSERLKFLVGQAEKFYGLMCDSKNPRFEFREAKEAFEDAIPLARKLGRASEAEALGKRLAYVKAVFKSRFDS